MRSARQTRRDVQHLWRICLVDGVIDETRVRQVVDLVAASGRGGTRPILTGLLRLAKLEGARRTAHVASATPLDDRTRAAIEDGLVRRYGRGRAVTFDVDPRLIGGTRVSIGSDVYDGSVRARLNALEARF
jgi:F-type H+-transporting ATPase subunit delta